MRTRGSRQRWSRVLGMALVAGGLTTGGLRAQDQPMIIERVVNTTYSPLEVTVAFPGDLVRVEGQNFAVATTSPVVQCSTTAGTAGNFNAEVITAGNSSVSFRVPEIATPLHHCSIIDGDPRLRSVMIPMGWGVPPRSLGLFDLAGDPIPFGVETPRGTRLQAVGRGFVDWGVFHLRLRASGVTGPVFVTIPDFSVTSDRRIEFTVPEFLATQMGQSSNVEAVVETPFLSGCCPTTGKGSSLLPEVAPTGVASSLLSIMGVRSI